MKWMLILFLASSFSLIIGGRPPVIKPFQFSGDLRQGLRIAVTCTIIEGEPPFQFLWYKDSQILQNNEKISIKIFDEFTSILSLKHLDSASNGNYTCRVQNAAGSDQKSDSLKMNGKTKSYFFMHILTASLKS
nr:junctional adhesion molecule A-like [Parasteatoda tepidariorum]